jgi:hypothetical protein
MHKFYSRLQVSARLGQRPTLSALGGDFGHDGVTAPVWASLHLSLACLIRKRAMTRWITANTEQLGMGGEENAQRDRKRDDPRAPAPAQ